MKPLLIAPRLPEDNNVWLFSGRRSDALHSALWGQSHAADRRDAELMLKLVQARIGWRALFKCFGPRVNPEGFDQVGEGPDAVPMPRLRL